MGELSRDRIDHDTGATERAEIRRAWVEEIVKPVASATFNDHTVIFASHEAKWEIARLHGRVAIGLVSFAHINTLALAEKGNDWQSAAPAVVAFLTELAAQYEEHLNQASRRRRIDVFLSAKSDRLDHLDEAAYKAVVDRYALLGGKASDLIRFADACEQIVQGATPEEVFAKAASGV